MNTAIIRFFWLIYLSISVNVTLFHPLFSFDGTIQLEEILRIDGSTAGQQFRTLSSLAYDMSRDEILVTDSDANRVYIFNRRGELSGMLGRGEELQFPSCVAVDAKGTIYVGEKESGLVKVFEGESGRLSGSFRSLTLPIGTEEKRVSPNRMTMGTGGDLYIVDKTNGWIFVFGPDNEVKFRFGIGGKDKNPFSFLNDAAVDSRGSVYTASRGIDPLNVFDREGNHLRPVRDPRIDVEDITDPAAVVVDRKNRLWVLDGLKKNLRVYDPSGHHIQTIGDELLKGGLFLPVDIEIDNYDNLYILERGASRLRVYQVRN